MKQKRKVKKIPFTMVLILLILVFVVIPFTILKITEDGQYYVEDLSTSEVQASYKHYIFASFKMDTIDSKYVCIKDENGKILRLQSGIVNLKTKDITENTEYTTDTDETGYVNGNYGADAQYLGTSFNGKEVHFKISGVQAWTDINNVELCFYNDSYTLSTYSVYNSSLIHTISTDIVHGGVNSISIGPAPKFLKKDTIYYSYDGHYFYSSFKDLIEDKKINEEPYYNYYQYAPHRTTSYLNNIVYNDFLSEYGINKTAETYPCMDNESVLYNQANVFLTTQKNYSINASMMFALALNESGFGQSQYAIEYNNLFGHAAIDENPDNANLYNSLADCIQQHAYNYLQKGYLNPEDSRYHGSWFGDKASGINVDYASDPYWGEKAASFYYRLDKNSIDKEKNPIKTVQLSKDLKVYAPNKKDVLYSYKKGNIISIHILKDENEYYKISSEAPVKKNHLEMDSKYKNSYAYIKKSNFK